MIVAGFIQMLGPMELTLLLILVLMLFGAGRLPSVLKQLGRGVRSLRDVTRIGDD